MVTTGYIRRTRCPAVLGLSRRPCCRQFRPLLGDIFDHGLMKTRCLRLAVWAFVLESSGRLGRVGDSGGAGTPGVRRAHDG